jgi:hypothetical protein
MFRHQARRSQRINTAATLLEALETRQLLSASGDLGAALAGETAATGEAGFETKTEHGQTESSFEIEVINATAGLDYDVLVDGTRVGSVHTNSVGKGKLEFKTHPEAGESGFPSNWPGVSSGSVISLTGLVTGTLSESGSGKHDDSDGDGIRNEYDDDGTDGRGLLTGPGVETGHVKFETEMEHGTSVRSFEVTALNLTAGATYTVTVDDIAVGSLVADARGHGRLKLSDTPEHDDLPFPIDFPAVTTNTVVKVGSVLSGTIANSNPATSTSNTGSGDHLRVALQSTGSVRGRAEFEGNVGSDDLQFQAEVWNAVAGQELSVTVDGTVVGAISVNARGYGALTFGGDHGVPFPANWPGVTDGSLVTVGDELSGNFSGSGRVADASPAEQDEAYELDHRLGLEPQGDLYENWGDRGEKWFRGGDSWYFITPDGVLHEWDGSADATGPVVASLDQSFYDQPDSLRNADAGMTSLIDDDLGAWVAADLDHDLNLQRPINDYENWGGRGEKWMTGDGEWYFILPSGALYQWDHSREARGELLTDLDARYHDNPDLLTDAVSRLTTAQAAFSVDRGMNLRTTSDDFLNWGGQNEKWLYGDDGWFFITGDGSLYKWDGVARRATGTQITKLSSAYYDDLTQLGDADTVGSADAEAVLDDVFTMIDALL